MTPGDASSGTIFLVQPDQSLQTMAAQPFENEAFLQTLLERYPDLLAGDQIDPSAPRRWILAAREAGVPGAEDGSDRWAIDHLFLDQDGVPTIVEVKRSSDTRIRREVVGQMLEYAAHAVAYWPLDAVRSRFEAGCSSREEDPAERIAELLGEAGDEDAVEEFWRQVGENLRAARIRLLFVADRIPPELRRIVEFLNRTMNPVEVLAVEIPQFVAVGNAHLRVLSSRVYGQTALEAERKKASGPRATRQWDEESFLAALSEPEDEKVAQRILRWAEGRDLRLWWGQGSRHGSCYLTHEYGGLRFYTISLSTTGHVYTTFSEMRKRPPFDRDELRRELLALFNAIPGISLPPEAMNSYKAFRLKILRDEAAMTMFLDTLDRIMATNRAYVDGQVTS